MYIYIYICIYIYIYICKYNQRKQTKNFLATAFDLGFFNSHMLYLYVHI